MRPAEPPSHPPRRRARPCLWGLLGLLLVCGSGRTQAQTGGKSFFLPQNPVAAAYVLGRLSNAELIAAPRSEFVYVALLERKGLERKYRVEALEGLSTLRHTTASAELLKALARLDKQGEAAADTSRELFPLLLQRPRAELAALRDSWRGLASEGQRALTRQIACAAWVAADNSIEPAWAETQDHPTRLADLISSIPLIQQAGLHLDFYSKLEPLVRATGTPEVRRASMLAMVSLPDHQADAFKTLAGFIATRTETETAIAGLCRLPQAAWDRGLAGPLATNLVAYLDGVPTADRTTTEFANALRLATDLSTTLAPEAAKALSTKLRGLGPTMVVLHAVYEQMRFDKQLIVVETGRPVSITLQNDDAMPHNLAILRPGTLEEIGQAAEKMTSTPDALGRLYVPDSPKLLWATRMIQPSQTGQLIFDAPNEPGDYPFTCTFPGHWRRMAGILAVARDADAYLASHAQAQPPKLTEWKLADLAPELTRPAPGRDPESGRQLFSKLACVQCHRLGPQGYAYGPDLSDVFNRYKNDRANVLEQILEPSKKIDDRYRNYNFELKDGDSVLGMLLKEDPETVTIQTGPADSLIQTLKKSEIRQRHPMTSSPMPVGLLNSLSKEQIFDLLAFLESGGKLAQHTHAP